MYHETDIHVLFKCVFVNVVWDDVGLKRHIDILPNDNILDTFKRLFARCS